MRKQNFALVLATVIVLAAMPIMAVDGAGAEIAEVETETADLSVSVYVGSPEYEFSESAVTDVEQMRQMMSGMNKMQKMFGGFGKKNEKKAMVQAMKMMDKMKRSKF